MELTLYTRKQCQLCDDAKMLLQILQTDLSFKILEKHIDLDDELTEKYGLMIPVVELDGEVIQYGNIDILSLEAAIKQRIN